MKLVTKLPLLLFAGAIVSCGDYQMTTPVTSGQEMSRMQGYPTPSGRPALRTPSAIGVLTTGRTDALDFGSTGARLQESGNIRSMQAINPFVSGSDYYQINDVLSKRAKLIHNTKFLGLDVILVCDQQTDQDRNLSLTQVATLGILDMRLQKQNTQLTVLCMDARTGYVYGVMGQQEDGRAPRLALFDTTVLGDPNRSYLVGTTRRDAVKQFPEFWNQIVTKYRK